jgi:hypothetical protein
MTEPLPTAPARGDDSAVRRRRLLGVGLRAGLVSSADTARDLMLARTPGGVDFARVEGIDALCQDLAVGLTTLRGSDPVNLTFGFLGLGPLVEQTSPVLATEALRGAVVELIAADPRVRRVIDVTTSRSTAGSRTLGVAVSFEAVSGEPATLNAGGLASGAPWGAVDTPGVTTTAPGAIGNAQ